MGSCEVPSNYYEITSNDPTTRNYMCQFGDLTQGGSNLECTDPYLDGGVPDMADVSIHSLNCDPCETNEQDDCNADTCFWNVTNSSEGNQCLDKCRSRITKGECEQYHVFNESSLSERIYSYDGNDGECVWRPNVGAMDTTVDSQEGICRRRDQLCYEPCTGPGDCGANESCVQFKEGSYCVNHSISKLDIGDVYCGEYYEIPNNCPSDPTNCGENCEVYRDPRYDTSLGPSSENGICISDGMENIDLLSGEHLGPLMTDEDCSEFSREQCSNYMGTGCIWEPFNEYCVPTMDTTNVETLLDSCKPIQGHVPPNYDVNMIHEEHLNISEYRDDHNQQFPYTTSKYLCDVCHVRDKDLDTIKQLDTNNPDELQHFMLKNYVTFTGSTNNTLGLPTITPQEYCERNINDGEADQFNPCRWVPDTSDKEGTCQSICSQHNPVDLSEGNTRQDLDNAKIQCSSHQWFPENDVHTAIFPNLLSGSEDDTDYFDDRYCSWDGFECHNSLPCKQTQQARCEDLGYDWYEGTALDVMRQAPEDLGIPLDLSSSYPIERKGDGKPVEGDMEGICVYPNTEHGYIGQPAEFNVQEKYFGNQVIMIKWREYGSGWWEDSSLCRKLHTTEYDDLKGILQENDDKTYFLGENVALIPFNLQAGDTPEIIKEKINERLRNYEYFVYNGNWVVWAADVIDAIDRSYDSTVDESYYPDTLSDNELNNVSLMNYGINYYSQQQYTDRPEEGTNERIVRQRLNVIYDMRGTIDLLPVLPNGRCALEIKSFNINTTNGAVTLDVGQSQAFKNDPDPRKFEFVEFIGKEIFADAEGGYTDNYDSAINNFTADIVTKLTLVKLSKFNYTDTLTNEIQLYSTDFSPKTLEEGYGTLYENKYKESLAPLNTLQSNGLYNIQSHYSRTEELLNLNYAYNVDSRAVDDRFHSTGHFAQITNLTRIGMDVLLNLDTSNPNELYYDISELSHTDILGPNPFPLSSIVNTYENDGQGSAEAAAEAAADYVSYGWADPIVRRTNNQEYATIFGPNFGVYSTQIYAMNNFLASKLDQAMRWVDPADEGRQGGTDNNENLVRQYYDNTFSYIEGQNANLFEVYNYSGIDFHTPIWEHINSLTTEMQFNTNNFRFTGEFTKAKAVVRKEGIPYYDLRYDLGDSYADWITTILPYQPLGGSNYQATIDSIALTTFTDNRALYRQSPEAQYTTFDDYDYQGNSFTLTDQEDPYYVKDMIYAFNFSDQIASDHVGDNLPEIGGYMSLLGLNPELLRYFTQRTIAENHSIQQGDSPDTPDFTIPAEVDTVTRLCSGSLESNKIIRIRPMSSTENSQYSIVTDEVNGIFNFFTEGDHSDTTNPTNNYTVNPFIERFNTSAPNYQTINLTSETHNYMLGLFAKHIYSPSSGSFFPEDSGNPLYNQAALYSIMRNNELVFNVQREPDPRPKITFSAPTIYIKSNFNLIDTENPLEDSNIRSDLEAVEMGSTGYLSVLREKNGLGIDYNLDTNFYGSITPPPRENTSLIRPFTSIDKHYLTGNRDLDEDNEMDGNYLSLDYDQATFVFYYDNELPPARPDQGFITNVFFGTGKNTETTDITTDQPASSPLETDPITNVPAVDTRYNIEISRTVTTYFTMSMVFPEQSTAELNICKELIRDTMLTCGNSLNWTSQDKDGCNECFGYLNQTNLELCSQYTNLIAGDGTISVDDDQTLQDVANSLQDVANSQNSVTAHEIAAGVGVCGILEDKRTNDVPWYYTGVTLEPPGFGDNLPNETPYTQGDCSLPGSNLSFTKLEGAGDGETTESVTFFKPVRTAVSDIFLDGMEDTSPYGCIRDDLTLMTEDYIKLSCNTNLATPVERDKHVLINYIIRESDGDLNISDRTKLAIMSEEELINKAIDLGIDVQSMNENTRPQLRTVTRDRLNPYVCEGTGEPCENDADCSGHYKCGVYEQWNDLQKYYYNIPDTDKKRQFTNSKQWDMIGCGIDLNYSDGTSGENVCKDKYPGLCETNADKCDSSNEAVREAIMLDCPETCNVQFGDLESYETDQVGPLSICTARGRCRWSHDQDPSNLLPMCEETTARSVGSVEDCRNYNSLENGPNAGSCNLYEYPETIDSAQCAEQRCLSMEGCVFTPGTQSGCYSEEYIDESIGSQNDCDSVGGRWVGQTNLAGECIISSYFNPDATENDCAIIGGNWRSAVTESCEFIPDVGYIGEDPCSHVVDLNDLTEDEQLMYFYEVDDLYVDSVEPEYEGDREQGEHPHFLKLNLNHAIEGVLDDMGVSIDYPIYPVNKYIHVTGNTNDLDSVCSPHIVGKSKIYQIVNPTTVIIGAPETTYIIPMDLELSELNGRPMIDIGGETACQVAGFYDIENYFTNSESVSNERDSCLNNPNGSCNYEGDSRECKSCGRYQDENECFNSGPHSQCGWGSVKNVCETIGDIGECNSLHMIGCEWNVGREQCMLNEMKDTDGNPLVSKIGCVKCSEIQHRDACDSIKNCFWDAVTPTDDGIGQCRACSSITDDTSDGILDDTGSTTFQKCDNFQLTRGQCQFRSPSEETTGIWDSMTHFLTDEVNLMEELFTTPDISEGEHSVCESEGGCKCLPTRLYPLFPDWIFHNIVLLVVFIPFVIYFIVAWYRIFCSPFRFKELGESSGSSMGNMANLAKKAKSLKKGGARKSSKDDYDDDDLAAQAAVKAQQDKLKKTTKYKDSDGKEREAYSNQGMLGAMDEFMSSDLSTGRKFDKYRSDKKQGVLDQIKLKQGDGIFSGMFKTETLFKRESFHELFPPTEVGAMRKTIVLKIFFLVISFPFTILQYLSNHIRFAIPTRLHNAIEIPGIIYILTIPTPLGYLLQALWWLATLFLFFWLISVGVSLQLHFLDYGVKENHKYVDPVNINTLQRASDGEAITRPPSAKWPQRLYREEWDEMIEDPLAPEVLNERNEALPEIFQGDYLSASKIANAEIEPEDLNWSKYLRKPFQWYNNFVNYLGDEFILNWILGTIIMYGFYRSTNAIIENFQATGDQTGFIVKMLLSYVGYALIYGFFSALMKKPETQDDEYDGAEIKCYGDIPIPYLKINGESVNYPKICFGRSIDDEYSECPYGCVDKHTGFKCKDNRSIFTLGGVFDPDPKLNLPVSTREDADWSHDDSVPYTCPPPPAHLSKFPYDALCSSGQTRCIATNESKLLMAGTDYPDEYCEIQYRTEQGGRDDRCINNNWSDPVTEGVKGPLQTEGYDIQCQLQIPDFSQDTNCPFEMAVAELNYDFDEMEQRRPASLWQWGYDEVFNGGEVLTEPEQISWQNENRYLIVNQQYSGDMFS